jgi:PAS domain S-box-containing protein
MMSTRIKMNELELSAIDLDQPPPDRGLTDGLPKSALAGLAAIVLIAIVIPSLTISSKREQVVEELQQRMRITVEARAEVLSTWLEGTARLADRLVGSELFRLFASDVDAAGGSIGASTQTADAGDTGLGIALLEQLPYMERVLTDFVISADFISGYIVGRTGVAYVTSRGAVPLSAQQAELALDVLNSSQRRFGAPHAAAAGLVLDIYIPILPAGSETEQTDPVAVLVVTAPVAVKLAESLEPRPLTPTGEELHLVHKTKTGLVELLPTKTPEIRPLDNFDLIPGDESPPFFAGLSLDGTKQIYAHAAAIAGEDFWAVLEMDRGAALADLRTYTATVIVAVALVVFTITAVFGAVWFQLRSSHSRMMADQFRHLAARIQTQKRFLDSINGSIADHIGLKAADGSYRYANSAFARAVGRAAEEIVGMDDAALFGKGTADRLALSDRAALESGSVITSNEEIYLDGNRYYLQFSKLPFLDEQDQSKGVVSVARDVTELAEEQKKRDRAMRQMVNALVHAIELRDPYLAGHTRRVASLAVAVARRLNLSAQEISTLEIAANLSQLGKLAISRQLLNKPGRLDEAEIAEIRKHVDHAAFILRDIDFELPVQPTIYQMHERLDGRGYPAGLKADEILVTAQILGACDVFVARIEPRSYRAGLSNEEALTILDGNRDRYAHRIVEALREVVGSVAGEKLLAGLPANEI